MSEITRADWCKRFANALLVLDETTDQAEADWLSQAAYSSARLLVPEDAAARLLGIVAAQDHGSALAATRNEASNADSSDESDG